MNLYYMVIVVSMVETENAGFILYGFREEFNLPLIRNMLLIRVSEDADSGDSSFLAHSVYFFLHLTVFPEFSLRSTPNMLYILFVITI